MIDEAKKKKCFVICSSIFRLTSVLIFSMKGMRSLGIYLAFTNVYVMHSDPADLTTNLKPSSVLWCFKSIVDFLQCAAHKPGLWAFLNRSSREGINYLNTPKCPDVVMSDIALVKELHQKIVRSCRTLQQSWSSEATNLRAAVPRPGCFLRARWGVWCGRWRLSLWLFIFQNGLLFYPSPNNKANRQLKVPSWWSKICALHKMDLLTDYICYELVWSPSKSINKISGDSISSLKRLNFICGEHFRQSLTQTDRQTGNHHNHSLKKLP